MAEVPAREPGKRCRHSASRAETPREHGKRAGTESQLRVSPIPAGVGFQPPRHAQEPHQPGRRDQENEADRPLEALSIGRMRVHRRPIVPGEGSKQRKSDWKNLEMDLQITLEPLSWQAQLSRSRRTLDSRGATRGRAELPGCDHPNTWVACSFGTQPPISSTGHRPRGIRDARG
jgi:hypothetical protein